MRFRTEQQYPAPIDQVLALYTDPTFYPTLSGLPKISAPEVVDHQRLGDQIRLSLRQRYTGDLPAAALTVIDPDKLSWVEQLEFDLRGATATSVLVPDHYADRFQCSGRYRFTATSHGTTRELAGEVKVRVLLVGGKVEGALVSGLREHGEAEAAIVAARLSGS
ncbi:MAG TPA: DUF2505 domain-containing protein [Acidimicrobiales bacterium]|nr:DUF2505 domain-containing protein [Acidimicrobiales bacterium]